MHELRTLTKLKRRHRLGAFWLHFWLFNIGTLQIKTGLVSLHQKKNHKKKSLVASSGTSESICIKTSYVFFTIHFPFKPPVGWGGIVSTQSNVDKHFHHAHSIHVASASINSNVEKHFHHAHRIHGTGLFTYMLGSFGR